MACRRFSEPELLIWCERTQRFQPRVVADLVQRAGSPAVESLMGQIHRIGIDLAGARCFAIAQRPAGSP